MTSLFESVHDEAARDVQPDRLHRLLETRTLLGLGNHVLLGTDQLDSELIEYAATGEVHGDVQAGLSTECRQQRVGSLDLDDLLHVLPGDRLDVGPIRHLGIGHDRGGVRVDQDHLVTLLTQRLARLHTGIVELAGLTNYDRA